MIICVFFVTMRKKQEIISLVDVLLSFSFLEKFYILLTFTMSLVVLLNMYSFFRDLLRLKVLFIILELLCFVLYLIVYGL